MAKPNTPDAPLVSAVDPRTTLQGTLDETIMQLESRNRILMSQRKQLDMEMQANDDAIAVARDGIHALDNRLALARELAMTENA